MFEYIFEFIPHVIYIFTFLGQYKTACVFILLTLALVCCIYSHQLKVSSFSSVHAAFPSFQATQREFPLDPRRLSSLIYSHFPLVTFTVFCVSMKKSWFNGLATL